MCEHAVGVAVAVFVITVLTHSVEGNGGINLFGHVVQLADEAAVSQLQAHDKVHELWIAELVSLHESSLEVVIPAEVEKIWSHFLS